MHTDLETPQSWGLAIQKHPAAFQGLKFKSRFNAKPCLALFDRDTVSKRLLVGEPTLLLESDAAAGWLHKHKVCLY